MRYFTKKNIYKTLESFNKQKFEFGHDIKGIEDLPDGAIEFQDADDSGIRMTVQINDSRIEEYHSGNGVTKIYLELNGH